MNLKTTNLTSTPSLDALAEEKLLRPIKRLLAKDDKLADILLDVEFGRTTHHHRKGEIWRAEAQLALPHRKWELRADAEGESLEEAVNLVKSELLRRIKKYKEKSRI